MVRTRGESLQAERDTRALQRERRAMTWQGMRSDLALWQHWQKREAYLRKLIIYQDAVQQKRTTLADRFAQLTTPLLKIELDTWFDND